MVATRRFVLIAALGALAACSPPVPPHASAPAADDPVALVQGFYTPYLAKQNPKPFEEAAPLTDDLTRQMQAAHDLSKQNDEPNAVVDFDPIVNAQDWEISDLHVALAEPIQGDHARVRADFKNFNEAGGVTYDLLRQNGAWRVDNITGPDWNLRGLLTELGIH